MAKVDPRKDRPLKKLSLVLVLLAAVVALSAIAAAARSTHSTNSSRSQEHYSYVFEGNSQALDQILVSPALADVLVPGSYDVVHVNAEFADQASDHDPQVARFLLPAP